MRGNREYIINGEKIYEDTPTQAAITYAIHKNGDKGVIGIPINTFGVITKVKILSDNSKYFLEVYAL